MENNTTEDPNQAKPPGTPKALSGEPPATRAAGHAETRRVSADPRRNPVGVKIGDAVRLPTAGVSHIEHTGGPPTIVNVGSQPMDRHAITINQ